MASDVPLQSIDEDDDEEFDWEAAVREIDVSCQQAKPSASSTPENSSTSYFAPLDGTMSMRNLNNVCNVKKGPGSCKQSTLDKFIGKAIPRPQSEGLVVVENPKEVRSEADERVPFVAVDAEAAKTWIYPVNIPRRDYQFAITKTALFSNTLVALPTGLGKTLIAAVVMYNYFRWFPDGKIVFTAPSRPLVKQQIKACHNVVGIPQEWTIDMTGQVSPTRRACFWKEKRVFFVTPQVLEKDIQSGTCLVKYLVCLVIDEAHRALGNYSYCVAVRELMAVPVQLRILALTATPGSKQQTIQLVINNLCISMLEYRNENDHDVCPYVNERKIELIQVPLGRDAIEINKRLLEVIHPYVARLSAFGLLQNRDYQTLSPCDLLNSRDKFRQAPPLELPHSKIGEFEAYFGILITLYHIRKLLASHGIRPAYEMLEEKLKQGFFARLMSRNEDIMNAKLLMEQSLSHGAPSPKLSKMLEVLVDHFKAKDAQNSRVIIFSNFRGSVRDIMSTLAKVGQVKATEFIGQSSGKALKGQSQKVQQAVLEKFRGGGYNVIVATSIGEEGLDIVEVDLVICFDANISPLRMIQRMGRTGRKNDGRVVVLACEGSEIKGYIRKQANSTAMKKHMRHGGMNSFNFHSSPRMIPHILKPEVKFVELSIEQFVPHGKKVKDDNHSIQAPVFNEKLTIAEIDSITKYFHPDSKKNWTPSLIAFPHFQAFPSRVHKVMHSYRTGMLIEKMQELLGLSFPKGKRSFVEDEVCSEKCLGIGLMENQKNGREDSTFSDNSPGIKSPRKATGSELSPVRSLQTEKNRLPITCSRINPTHSYLFGSDFVSVDTLGKVFITSVPSFPFKKLSHSICTSASAAVFVNHSKQSSSLSETLNEGHEEIFVQAIDSAVMEASQTRCKTNKSLPKSRLLNSIDQQDTTIDEVETVPESPILKRNLSDEREYVAGMLDALEIKAPPVLPDEYNGNFSDSELSPRLTNMIKNGVLPESPISPPNEYDGDFRDAELSPRLTNIIKNGVLPESPISQVGLLHDKKGNEFPISTAIMELPSKSSTPEKKVLDNLETRYCGRNILFSPVNREVQTPLCKMNNNIADTTGCANSASPVTGGFETPMPNLTNSSNSKDWHLSSGGHSEYVKRAHKFKRLCKNGDHGEERNPGMKEKSVLVANLAGSFSGTSPNQMKYRTGKRRSAENIMAFIEDEAEVSSDAEISDEVDNLDSSSYDDSFIDDRINPTAVSTQAEAGQVDIMAIYRRSLLSQSPICARPNSSAITPDSGASVIGTNKSGSWSACSLQTPQTDCARQSDSRDSKSFRTNSERLEAMTCKIAEYPKENGVMENRKRKLSFHQSGTIPAVKLQSNISSSLEVEGRELIPEDQSNKTDPDGEMTSDDQFYENIDFDALEAQATLLLNHKPEETVRKQDTILQSNQQNSFLASPTFDLGIL